MPYGIRTSDENDWIKRIHDFKINIKYGGVVNYPTSKSWYVVDPNGYEIKVSFAENKALKFPNLVETI